MIRRSALVLAALTLAACVTTAPGTPDPAASPSAGVLAGTVVYRARIALPPDAVAEVRLVDAAGGVVARETIPAAGRQVPLPFALRYAPEAIRTGVAYTLHADIRDGVGRTLWATAAARPVLGGGQEATTIDLVLTPASGGDEAAAVIGLRWRLVGFVRDGDAMMLPPGERLTLTVGTDGSYTGQAGCVAFGGTAGSAAGPLTLGPARSTMQACPPPTASTAFLGALGGAAVDAVRGGSMTLVSPDGTRLRFERGLDAWDEARQHGVTLRAVGQEPGWTLEVAAGRQIEFVTGYGERRVVAPDPDEQADGGRTVYTATTDAGALRVVVVETPCADAMSAAPYPLTVEVTLGNETVAGCGRALD